MRHYLQQVPSEEPVFRPWIAALPFIACLLPCAASAQDTTTPAEDHTPTIKVDVDVVNVLFSVRDGKGRLVANLDKSDFELREDGKPQPILYFTRESALPLTLGLLVDSSVSQGGVIEKEQAAARVFFERVIGSRDAAFLISFDVSVDLLQDVTGSVNLLQDSLESIRIRGTGPVGSIGGPFPPIRSGGTHLYDAVYLAATEILSKEAGRKAVVLLSDGQDQGSSISREAALEAAHRTDVMVYAILFVDRNFYGFGGAGYDGESILKKLTEETGGRLFRASSDRELADAFDQISDELRRQYSIGYSPSNAAHDGSFRKIQVRVRGRGLRVQARRGYYAPLDDGKPAVKAR
jgi:VWFA-related protein